MKRYYIEISSGNKAKSDIDEICNRNGFLNLTKRNYGNNGIGRFMTKVASVSNILFRLKKGDILLLQYPMKKFYKIACRFAHMKGAKVVTVIHDLGAFRRKRLNSVQENARLSLTDFLIVHNSTMHKYLIDNGYKGGVHDLGIFDYLSDKKMIEGRVPHKPWKVVYAGSMGYWRSGFLYKLDECSAKWDMDLYGNGFEEEKNCYSQLHYHGFMQSDSFIGSVEGDFGLVWDGDSLDKCTGAWGEYLKINNPHKTSFYIRAGIPVIVWSKSAMASFVIENNLGIAVDSIRDIESRLNVMTAEEYAKMQESVSLVGKRLNDGYYFMAGFNSAIKYFEKEAVGTNNMPLK